MRDRLFFFVSLLFLSGAVACYLLVAAPKAQELEHVTEQVSELRESLQNLQEDATVHDDLAEINRTVCGLDITEVERAQEAIQLWVSEVFSGKVSSAAFEFHEGWIYSEDIEVFPRQDKSFSAVVNWSYDATHRQSYIVFELNSDRSVSVTSEHTTFS